MAKHSAPRKRHAGFAKRLVIMAKRPALGQVKRRLGQETGDVVALHFYRNSLAHIVQRLAGDSRWLTVLAVTPDRAIHEKFPSAAARIGRLPQGQGDLGRRMQHLFRDLPPGPVVVVGSDIPALRPCHIAEAFKLLGSADAVFGPAADGGYWLVGLRRSPNVLRPFIGVRWSGRHALADTLANLEGRRVAFTARLGDVDTKIDLDQERDRAQRLILALGRRRINAADGEARVARGDRDR